MKKQLLFLIPILLSGCTFFNKSKKVDLIPYVQKEKYGYFDLQGKITINPQFSFATAFRDDLALVKTLGEKGKWGFINKKGKFVINATYKDATVFREGLAWVVSDNSAPSAIDKTGEVKFTLKEAEQVALFSDGLAAFSKADSTSTTWGFVDKLGKEAINPQFIEVGNFNEGKCAVKNKEGKWGYIDTSGKIVINYQFDDASKFEGGKAIIYVDFKAGVIDNDGKYVINPQFQHAYTDGNKYLISQDDKYGWCDSEGKFLINPQFEDANVFGNSKLASVKSGSKYGYVDEDGKITINPQFDGASKFIDNVAIVMVGDRYGLVDEEGKYIVNPQFDGIADDLYYFINDNSIKRSINSDFLDVASILKVINTDKPENLSFDDSFKTILEKKGKSLFDFSTSDDIHSIFKDKFINNESIYDFMIMGKFKKLNPTTFEYYASEEKPTGFVYVISLKGRGVGKIEFLQREFEKKLINYNLMKKGYLDGEYTGVFKSDKNIIVTLANNSNTASFYILNSDFDISGYLNKITENINQKKSPDIEKEIESSMSVDTAIIADTTMIDTVGY